MHSVAVSWGLFISLLGVVWWIYSGPRPRLPRRAIPEVAEGNVFLSSGTEGAAAGEKKKKKKRKSATSSTVLKKIVPNEDGSRAVESTDDDAAEDDEIVSLRRLQALSDGSGSKKLSSLSSSTTKQPGSQKAHLVAPASPFATASQTSSTGADADIDEEEATQLPGSGFQQSSSTDPRDMVEEPIPGARVLTITPSTQPPRPQTQRNVASSTPSGVHASKNAKKTAKKRLEKEAERADQKARFEQHRATMRAAEVAKQKTKPASEISPVPSVWTKMNGDPALTTAEPSSKPPTGDLLDTFTPSIPPIVSQHSPADSEEEKNPMRSTYLDGSYWEEIPDHLIGGWNEVQRKGRKQKKSTADPDTGKSGDESSEFRSKKENIQTKTEKPVVPKKGNTSGTADPSSKGGNGFQLLDTGSTTSDTKNSSSDWAEVDDSDNWAVHPES